MFILLHLSYTLRNNALIYFHYSSIFLQFTVYILGSLQKRTKNESWFNRVNIFKDKGII